jgi:heme/copper-type cytochrome/quinol oxidase subunit 2
MINEGKNWMNRIARVGLVSKGIVYVILGALAFMAAFELAGQSNEKASRTGVFDFIKDFPGGIWLLMLLAAGLLCYSIWRGVQAVTNTNDEEKVLTKRIRYFFSGLIYLFVAYTAVQIALQQNKSNGDKNQQMASELLNKPYGVWLLAIAALIIAAVGIYQIYYGLSGKYKKHVQKLNLHTLKSSLLLRAGKIGYIARGLVWLVISFLLIQAAVHAKSSEAGDTSKAFQFIEDSEFGSYLLAILGVGLIAYGIFNFIRARYENFK